MEFPSWWQQETGLTILRYSEMQDDFTMQTGLPLFDQCMK